MHDLPARPAHGKTGSAPSSKNDLLVDLFSVPWKMALFPDGFDAKPEDPPDPCPTRLPDPPMAKLEVHHRQQMIFGFSFPGKWPYSPMEMLLKMNPENGQVGSGLAQRCLLSGTLGFWRRGISGYSGAKIGI